ncbi:MAG: Ig-like domain-containing protein [Capnocytophaga sp.]|nr:Ig-like domain-containing protein [Capnocytophaga sp.]
MKVIIKLLSIVAVTLTLWQCARVGSPTGGDKDITPPEVLRIVPPSGTTNFTGNRIRIYFDELVTLKDVRKQLIISPPLNNFPDISPAGNAARYLDIKITDTLKPNTTYTFNFGRSIQDNNEGNPLNFFSYVFSTGNTIDSLSVKGKIKDAISSKPDNFVNVMLYEVTEKFTDSIIYKEKPTYIVNTLDSLDTFEIKNVKAGKYMLIAMKDKASNYLFDQKQDKIGFYPHFIEVPTDTIYELSLFKEVPNNNTSRPFQAAESRISIGYEGERDSIRLQMLPPLPPDFKYTLTKDRDKDTLNLWFSPKIEDSLKFIVRNEKTDTVKVNFRKMKPDEWQISSKSNDISPSLQEIIYTSNIPLDTFNQKMIHITAKDSSSVHFTSEIDSNKLDVRLKVPTKQGEKYKVMAYPEAFINFYGQKNDTLQTSFSPKPMEEYASLKLKIGEGFQFPILIELTNEKGTKVEYAKYLPEKTALYQWEAIKPSTYQIRIIEDKNKNEKWDTGNYLQKIAPENVYHFPKPIELRANWDIEQDIIPKNNDL